MGDRVKRDTQTLVCQTVFSPDERRTFQIAIPGDSVIKSIPLKTTKFHIYWEQMDPFAVNDHFILSFLSLSTYLYILTTGKLDYFKVCVCLLLEKK